MDGFIDVVNAIGGVTVHLDCPFYEPVFNLTTNAWDYFALPAGDAVSYTHLDVYKRQAFLLFVLLATSLAGCGGSTASAAPAAPLALSLIHI